MRRRVRVIGWLSAAAVAGLCGVIGAQPARTAGRKPQVWAVVVGVGNYHDPRVSDNPSAASDAGSVRDWFLEKAGWPLDHVLYLSDRGNRLPGAVGAPRANILPSRENLDWAFRAWLPSRAKPGDMVLFYYSGRAGAAESPAGGLTDYLLPTEANAGNVGATGWALDRAVDRFVRETSGRCQVVCWLATAAVGKPGPGAEGPAKADGRDWLGRLVRWPNVCAWLAADRPPGPPGHDEPSARFTRALIEGMGAGSKKQNLAACLAGLRQDPALRLAGFQAMGAVPPRLTVWSDLFGQAVAAPRPEVVLQVGHAGRVNDVVITADGLRAVTAGDDSTVRVWSLKDRALLRVLTGHQVGVSALGLGGGDRWLVSGGGRPASGVLFHDLKDDPRRVVPDQPHGGPLARVAILPDGGHCVTIDTAARGFLWDLNAGPPEPRPWPGKGVNCLDVASGGGVDSGRVAALCDDRSVRLFDASGAGQPARVEWPDQPVAVAVDTQGRRLAVGFDDGRVEVRDLSAGEPVTRKVGDGPVSRLVFSAGGLLAVGHDQGLAVCTFGASDAGPGVRALGDRPVGPLAFAPDGRGLAAADRDTGALSVWRFEPGGSERTLHDDAAGVSALAFAADGRGLVTGGHAGALTTRPLGGPAGGSTWVVPAHRARVLHLSASPSRRHLLIVDERNQARVWDLAGRSCRRLPGAWTSGAFTTGDDRLVLTPAAGKGQSVRPSGVRLEGGKVTADREFFQDAGQGVPEFEASAFERLTLAPDGTRVAASSGPGQPPLVCVWEAKTGRLTHWLRPAALGESVRSLSFSTDGRRLLTAGDSPEARLWDLGAGAGELRAPAVTFRDTGPGARNVTAAAVRPGDGRQVVTGHRDGLIRLWTWREGEAGPVGRPLDLALGAFPGEVKALAFASDGRDQYLAASGDGTSLWLARMADPRPVPVADLGERPHHWEQVNALIPWTTPGGPLMLASGSDDATVKVWEVRDRALRLRGTFAPADEGGGAVGAPGAVETDWVVYTPDGHFDASARGRELVRLRHNDRVRAMEQFDDTKLYTFDLGERLLTADNPAGGGAGPADPPPVAIAVPPLADPVRPEARVSIALGSDDLRDVRLYHNDVPVRTGLEEQGGETAREPGGRLTVPVRLVKGANRFYVLATAARGGETFDSRSPDVEVTFDGPTEPGTVHVLALGVGDYKKRRLKYAANDAGRLSEVLHAREFRAGGRSSGRRIVRTDDEVSVDAVNKAFTDLAGAVKGRPQDTVVVFLAGHTGVFEPDQFCLLLPSYPFPAEAPRVAEARGAVVARAGGQGGAAAVDPKHLMPYALIEANLMRLDALNRLVIVDACQAESILDDGQVKAIRKWMEVKSRRARTSYLMAARRGEPAVEVEDLRHGLFTYVLLRGLGDGSESRERDPEEISRVALRADADFDGDGVITTGELDEYARLFLPPVAGLFPQLMTRSLREAAADRPDAPRVLAGDLDQGLRVQGANVSFPLVPLPRATVKP